MDRSSSHFVFIEEGRIVLFQGFKYVGQDCFAVPAGFVDDFIPGKITFHSLLLIVVEHESDLVHARVIRLWR